MLFLALLTLMGCTLAAGFFAGRYWERVENEHREDDDA